MIRFHLPLLFVLLSATDAGASPDGGVEAACTHEAQFRWTADAIVEVRGKELRIMAMGFVADGAFVLPLADGRRLVAHRDGVRVPKGIEFSAKRGLNLQVPVFQGQMVLDEAGGGTGVVLTRSLDFPPDERAGLVR